MIHDYLKHNRSMEQVMHARADAKERKSKSRGHSTVTTLSQRDMRVTSGQTPEHQNTRTPKKEKEEYSSSFSKEISITDFEQAREKAHANAEIIKAFPDLDLPDSWNAFTARHHGETRTVTDWTRQWKGWCERRARMSGIPPSKPHVHSWQCDHVLAALHRTIETAQPDQTACQLADQLNKETQ